MKNIFLFIVFLNMFQHPVYSQDQHKLDSLHNELKKFEAYKMEMGSNASLIFDTTKVNILNKIAKNIG